MRVRVRPPDLRRWLPAAALAVLAVLALPACSAASAPAITPPQPQPPAQQAQGQPPPPQPQPQPQTQAAAKPLASAGVAETFDPAADFGAAPDVNLVTADGSPFNLARQQGKVTLVYLTPW